MNSEVAAEGAQRPSSATAAPPGGRFASWEGLSRSEVVSFLYKSLRLGDPEGAYIAVVVLRDKFRVGNDYLLKTLIGLTVEDCAPSGVRQVLPTLHAIYGLWKGGVLGETHTWQAIAHATYAVATCPKWYMEPEGEAWSAMLQLFRPDRAERTFDSFRLPGWTFDEHTSKGKGRIRDGTADLRLSGSWENCLLDRHWEDVVPLRVRWREFEVAHPELDHDSLRRAWVQHHYDTVEWEPRAGKPGRAPGYGASPIRDAAEERRV